MKRTIQVRPLKDIVRDPQSRTMRALDHDEPTTVPDNSYWRRRIKCGDCELVTAATSPAAPAAPVSTAAPAEPAAEKKKTRGRAGEGAQE